MDSFYFRLGAFMPTDDEFYMIGYDQDNKLAVINIQGLQNNNPYGFEAAFYRFTRITSPLMKIVDPTFYQEGLYSVYYGNIKEAEPDNIEALQYIKHWDSSAMFWDCETYSPFKDFTIPERKEDIMISISAVFINDGIKHGYLLLNNWGKIGAMSEENLFEGSEPYEITVLNFDDEKAMIVGFWDLIFKHHPNVIVDFNGKSYDIPYLTTRMALHGIEVPNMSYFMTDSKVVKTKQSVMGQTRMVPKVKIDGILFVDLLHHMKMWFDITPDHKLDTFSRYYLGEGKTGMSIAELFHAYQTRDVNKLTAGAEYSMRDAIVLEETWRKVHDKIELSASSLGINPDMMTTFLTYKDLCGRLFWTCGVPFKFIEGPSLGSKAEKNAIYINVSVCTYETRMLNDIAKIGEPWALNLVKRLRYSPLKVVSRVYEALMKKGLIDRKAFTNSFIGGIRKQVKNKNIIGYKDGLIYTESPVDNDEVVVIDSFEAYFNRKVIGRIIRRSNGDVQYFGTVAKSECKLIKKLIENCFHYMTGEADSIEPLNLESLSIKDFVYKKSVSYDSAFQDLYVAASDRTKELLMEAGYSKDQMIIADKIPVSWVVTPNGAVLYDEFSDQPYQIDYDHYTKSWEKFYDYFVDEAAAENGGEGNEMEE